MGNAASRRQSRSLLLLPRPGDIGLFDPLGCFRVPAAPYSSRIREWQTSSQTARGGMLSLRPVTSWKMRVSLPGVGRSRTRRSTRRQSHSQGRQKAAVLRHSEMHEPYEEPTRSRVWHPRRRGRHPLDTAYTSSEFADAASRRPTGDVDDCYASLQNRYPQETSGFRGRRPPPYPVM
jgi:hypothetical protein